jgi:hypothetical protein
METWKPIASIKKKGGRVFTPYGYEVSNLGRVRTKRQRYGRPRKDLGNRRAMLESYNYLSGRNDGPGYISYCLYDENKNRINIRGHVLVMQTFVGYPEEGQVVCHFDDVKSNNVLSNLRYDTQKANMKDSKRNKSIKS